MRDVSQRRMLENQLRQSQKMETVGRLAGGVAHDFNNLLTAIQGYTALLQSALPENSEERGMTDEVIDAVQRASRLTTQLLTFSRQEVPNPVPLNLNAIVAEMEKMLERLIRENVRLDASLDPSLWPIEGDRGRIEQVVTNLVINAADAMPTGGVVTIRTRNLRVNPKTPRPPGVLGKREYVVLSVKDEGQGMDSETLPQIFEPFFTTKPPGRGTGLGLATVYGIVKQADGCIHVESEPGEGSTFEIYLPRKAGSRTSPKRDSPQAGWPVQETILIVEDEPAVRRLTRRYLETSGYKVFEAENPADAIRMAKAGHGSIDLLLTDVIMPELSGPELAERLRELLPNLKVLYMSGYPGEFIARHGISERETAYLQKPFSQEDLKGKMREVLDS
jgi:nitrogen-specific signal transduction histidine kinase